jgi:dihydroxyacid dehydratase/phosphogluconate dehydratase
MLLSGCDKTTPAMLMGAASADIAAVMVTGGPMLSGTWRAEEPGSGTDAWRLWAERRAGRLTDEELYRRGLLKRGVKHMVRISDARMSGTSYGSVVLHVAPESAIGGPLALVRNGDEIELDVPRRRLTLKVSDDELARRRAA